MFRCRGDLRVDKATGAKLGTGFLGGALESELWELGKSCMRGYGAVVEVSGGVVDCCEDEVIRLWYVLCGYKH